MSFPGRTRRAPALGAIVWLLLFGVSSRGLPAANVPAVARGLQFLKSRAVGLPAGEMGLAVLAMLKADVPATDPTLAACLAKLRQRFTSEGYHAERSGGTDIYEAAVVAMALANLDAESRRSEIAALAQYLTSRQKANGSWDYDNRTIGDTSISQYAVLGLWEASNAGADVSPGVFDRAAGWFLSTQAADGGWYYHADAPDHTTITMTAAGTGSLLVCARQLAHYRENVRGEAPSKLLTALAAGGPRAGYEVANSQTRIDPAVKRGIAWLAASFTTSDSPVVGPSMYYGLYGIERIGALADRDTLGRLDWFEQGRRFILSSQQSDGSWSSTHGPEANTVWAILFMTRSTAKTLQRIEIKRLGAGTLLGGRGLPRDLSSLTVAGGRIVSRPMNGAVEGMLAVLEDPRAQNADSALAGMLARYQAGGPGVLRPYKDRFRALLADRDSGLRQVSAWALARTGDLDVVPDLIGALVDDDLNVVDTARQGLQLLSRKLAGLGPPPGSTPEQRQEAARRWREWYNRTRPLDLEGQDDDDLHGAAGPRAETAMSHRDEPTRDPLGPERAPAFQPVVRGESLHDRVTSILMAVVIGAGLAVGWLLLIYATNQAYASRVTAPLQIIEVYGGGGGSPEGTPGSTEKIDVPGAAVASQASNNEEEAGDFEEPAVQETPAAMLDAVSQAGESLAEVDLGAAMPHAGSVASGRRASKLGSGGPGLGFGPGDGGVARERRWSIVYNPGQTLEEYARQLDGLGVEMAVITGDNQLTYISHFSSPTPATRHGSGQGDDRLYFLWQGRGRKSSDVALLKKAGIDVGESVVLQFYPKQVEALLAQLEVRYRGKQPSEIRVTRFGVVPRSDGYGFEVLAQETLR